MTALTKSRARGMERWTHHVFELAVGHKAYKNGSAAFDLTTGKVVPSTGSPNLFVIGEFDRDYDATDAEVIANINLGTEIEIVLWENDGSLANDDRGKLAFVADDQTVTLNTGGPVAGRFWGLVDGCAAIQKLASPPEFGGESALETTFPAFAANDAAIPANAPNGGVYDVGATGAASTVSLGAGTEGDVLYFTADGVNNAHTVQYRDGATPITAALTAAKRHLVIVLFLNGKWRANAYVSP